MARFGSRFPFTTSTPIQKQHDSGFCENSPPSMNLILPEQSAFLQLRKNLFRERKTSEDIPEIPFPHKCKRSSSYKRLRSSDETPRSVRSNAGSDKPVHLAEADTLEQHPLNFFNLDTPPFLQFDDDDDDSGFCDETVWFGSQTESSKEDSPNYFKHVLGAKRLNDLSSSEMITQYNVYRFQRMGLRPIAKENSFDEKHLPMKDVKEISLILWKDKLERISADLDPPIKIDFLYRLLKMNALIIVSDILSHLSGYDLQNAISVSRLWRKLVLRDKSANKTRRAYLLERQKLKEEMENRKLPNPFQRPPNFKILTSIENIQSPTVLQLKKTVKEINFDAFIEVGKKQKIKPKKCPSCTCLSIQDPKIFTKYGCVFCRYQFCGNCLKPYKNWHVCASTYLPAAKISAYGREYLRRL